MQERKPPGKPPKREPTTARSHCLDRSDDRVRSHTGRAGLDDLLRDPWKREMLGRSAQQRVHDNFLIFTQLRRWLVLIADAVKTRWS
ncbi:hypothetical protein ACETRX_35745 [Labrys portucalensis]|uniref:Uncharacterized protein n=1 Tax=Labrys neptuniae TaxID=376174 RepID=A0ABV6ZS14_9HYPH